MSNACALQFNDDSRQIMQWKSAPDSKRVDSRWSGVECMKTLGRQIIHDGCVWACVRNAIAQMWGAFFGKFCVGLVRCSEAKKIAFILNSLMSICSWRWGRWPYQDCVARKLDGVQAHFVQILFPVRHIDNESTDRLFTRKRQQASRLCIKMGRFSAYWAGVIKSWKAHLDNSKFNQYWSAQLASAMSFNCLEALRTANSRGSRRDRTGTRAVQGHVHLRWCEGLERARAVPSLKVALPIKSRSFGA